MWRPDCPGARPPFAWLALFALAMGYLESAVVVYLRQHWYPDGFAFPMVNLDMHTLITELGREAATLLMLLSVSFAVSGKGLYRFAVFIFCFGIWDLAYYGFLKILIGWPATLLDWDILFLIPVPWTGPVIAPVILSMLMIAFALALTRQTKARRAGAAAWTILSAGCLVVIYSFCKEYLDGLASGMDMAAFRPRRFPWALFLAGLAGILFPFLKLVFSRHEPSGGPTRILN
jgi:hypothetical protein